MTTRLTSSASTLLPISHRTRPWKWYHSTSFIYALQYDLKNKKVFLKRMACPGVTLDQLFLGSVIVVFARQLKLVEYGDLFTRQKFESKR